MYPDIRFFPLFISNPLESWLPDESQEIINKLSNYSILADILQHYYLEKYMPSYMPLMKKYDYWEKCNVIVIIYWYVLSTKQYILSLLSFICCLIHVQTGTRPYIRVWTRTYWHKTLYTRMKSVYLCTSPYIFAYETHILALLKTQ